MEMKRLGKRLLSMLLACVMVFGMLPRAYAAEADPSVSQAVVTFQVVNGTWDGTDARNQTVQVSLTDGAGTLDAASVPTGMTAAEGYEGGAWDVTPNTEPGGITADVTYTYSFTEKAEPIVITEVALNGFTEPAYGARPDYELTIPQGAHYHFASPEELKAVGFDDKVLRGLNNGIAWDWSYNDTVMKPEDTFIDTAERVYSIRTYLIADEGYTFAKEIDYTLDGKNMTWAARQKGSTCAYLESFPFTVTDPDGAEYKSRASITFMVENGRWKEGDAFTKAYDILLVKGKGTLPESLIPTGMTPVDNLYGDGSWDVTPDTSENAITGDTTYIYRFKEKTHVTITFKVENGTWEDGTTGDKTVDIHLTYDGALLPSNMVPTGMKPAKGYQDGEWDENLVTGRGYYEEDAAITYRFKPIDKDTTIRIDGNNFPDKNFRDYLMTLPEGKDGQFSPQELAAITKLECGRRGIHNLTGIAYFTSLTKLECEYNSLTKLDLSGNPALGYLYCNGNELTELNLSGNPNLECLHCYENQLKSLDVSNNKKLLNLSCSSNQLTALDLSANTKLTDLSCFENSYEVVNGAPLSSLAGFDVSKASNIAGGNFDGGKVNFTADELTYTYDCGQGMSADFTLEKKLGPATVTFKVVNGTWDGTHTADKTAEVTLTDGKGTLDSAQVPTGMQPVDGYEGGAWDVTPNTTTDAITGNVTYTYSFTKKADAATASYTVKHLQEKLGTAGTFEAVTADTQTLTGKAGENTAAVAKTYEGFTAQPVTQAEITADGKTVVEIKYTRNIHELKWDFLDGTAPEGYTNGKVPFGTPIVKPVPTKTGFTFDGWTTAVADTMPDMDVTYTAKWKAVTPDPDHPNPDHPDPQPTTAKYTVRHMREKLGTAGIFEQFASDSLTGTIGEKTAALARTEEGFTAQTVTQTRIAPDGSTVVEIKYTRNIHTLTFDPNGGQFEGSKSVKVPFGTSISAPNVVRDGFTFDGWKPAVPQAMPDKDVTCVAQWTTTVHTHKLTKAEGCKPTAGSDGWKPYYECSCGKFFEDENGTREIKDLQKWKQGEGKLPALGYKFLEGMNSTWKKESNQDLKFRANGDLEDFVSIEVDGRTVDRKNYTVESGSTIVLLKRSYLQSLKVGTHTLTVNFVDGECETQFRVANAPRSMSPKTGDESHLLMWSLSSMASLAAVIMISLPRKKRKN